jgi:hypothetical protein
MVSQGCYKGVTGRRTFTALIRGMEPVVNRDVTTPITGGYKGVTKVLQWCYKGVTRELQGCNSSQSKDHHPYNRMLKGCYKSVTRLLQGCCKGV